MTERKLFNQNKPLAVIGAGLWVLLVFSIALVIFCFALPWIFSFSIQMVYAGWASGAETFQWLVN